MNVRVFQTLLKRELGFYLTTLTGYVILSMVMFLIGLSLLTVILAYNGRAMDAPLTEAFYATPFFWFIVLLACPAITMRKAAHGDCRASEEDNKPKKRRRIKRFRQGCIHRTAIVSKYDG